MAGLRVVINGRGLDLMGALSGATMTDWRALLAATGRNPFTVAAGLQDMEKVAGDGPEVLAGESGAGVMNTICDLVFLARRMDDRENDPNPAKLVSYQQVSDELSFFDALGALTAAAEAAAKPDEVEADPT